MKKPLISILVGFLIISLFSGCNNNPKRTPSESKSDTKTKTGYEMKIVNGTEYPVLEIQNKKVTFLTHWDSSSDSFIQFSDRAKEAYGIEIEPIKTMYSSLPTKLASLQAAGDAPDLMIYYNQGYPSMFSKNMFQPIDDFVDFNDGFWSDAKTASDMLLWNGKHYMVADLSVTRFLWYNKTLFERNGLITPLERYKEDENYTWEQIIEDAKELKQDTDGDGNIDQWGISGNYWLGMMLASLNTALVTVERDKINNNINSEAVNKAMELAYRITNIDKSFNWDGQNLFRSGKVAMYFEGHWIASGDEVLIQMLKNGEIGFVPHPVFEGSKEKRYSAELTGYLIPTGAKNKEGAQAVIIANRAYGKTEASMEESVNRYKEMGFSEDMLDLYKKFSFKQEFLAGPQLAICGDSLRFAWEPMRLLQDEGLTWPQIRERLYPLFQAEIDKELENMKKGS